MVGHLSSWAWLPRKVSAESQAFGDVQQLLLHDLDRALGHLGQQDHGELASKIDHARVGHVDAGLEQRCGQFADQTGAIGPHCGDHEL